MLEIYFLNSDPPLLATFFHLAKITIPKVHIAHPISPSSHIIKIPRDKSEIKP